MRVAPRVGLGWALIGLALVMAFGIPSSRPAAEAAVTRVVNVASQAGIAQTTRTWSAAVGDYDKNRREDFFLVRHDPQSIWSGDPGPRPTLYRNRGGDFSSSSATHWTRSDKHDCDWGDVNRDRRPDLFCAIGLDARSKNELWVQRGDGSFANRAEAYGLTKNTHGEYRTATFLHANGDSWPDIYVSRYTGNDGSNSHANELWLNRRGRSFARASSFGLNKTVGAQKDTNGCTEAVDYDRDGRDDLLFCAPGGLRLYHNRGGSFRNVAKAKGIGGFSKDAAMSDLNGDKRPDLVLLRSKSLRVKRQTASGKFVLVKKKSVSAGESVALGDFDGNGFKDAFAVSACPSSAPRSDRPDVLLRNSRGQFTGETLPALDDGCGQTVARIDYDRDGMSDFLVLNGRKKVAGPVQLFTSR
jgi:FG-GAP-like repeat